MLNEGKKMEVNSLENVKKDERKYTLEYDAK